MNLEPKRDGRRKCRLILQGFREPKEWDQGLTDSPVAAMSTIRTLLFRGGHDDEVVSAVDVTTAFLQAEAYGPEDPVRYVSYKPHKHSATEYYQLTGVLYGQRSASLRWFKTLSEWLVQQNFEQGQNDPCIFHKRDLTVVAYVDDLICRGSPEASKAFYKALEQRFDIKDPSYLSPENKLNFVGFDLTERSGIRAMDQNVAMRTFLDEHNVTANTGVQCPMPTAANLYDDPTPLNDEAATDYRRAIGSLNYFSVATRYDIAHAVSRLSQYTAQPTVSAQTGLKRVLMYLAGNTDFAVEATISHDNAVEMYCDSDHGGDRPGTTKSQTGMMFCLNNGPVHWSSKKQVDSTACSSALAEIYALSESVRAGRLFAWRAEEMGINVQWPLVLQVDNRAAITFQLGTCLQSRLRGYIDMRAAWVRELRDQNLVTLKKVTSENNLADILTKCLPNYKFQLLLRKIRRDQATRNMQNDLDYVGWVMDTYNN
jgi:hypothetical protein